MACEYLQSELCLDTVELKDTILLGRPDKNLVNQREELCVPGIGFCLTKEAIDYRRQNNVSFREVLAYVTEQHNQPEVVR